MTAADFHRFIERMPSVELPPETNWDSLIDRYPYASSLYVCKVLAMNSGDASYDETLHRAAARTLSRSRLQWLVEGAPQLEYHWEETVSEPENSEVISAPSEEAKDAFLENEITEIIPSKPRSENVFGFSFVRVKSASAKKQAEVLPAASPVKTKGKKSKQQDLIDRFINEEPILQPRLEFGGESRQPDLARKSGKLQEEIISESMVMIYIRQKKYPQAIATLHKLCLKIPEKSDYFAALIKNLENQKPT
jgi:hypothetical protein